MLIFWFVGFFLSGVGGSFVSQFLVVCWFGLPGVSVLGIEQCVCRGDGES